MDFIIPILAKTKAILFNPLIENVISTAIAFTIGVVAGFVTFSNDFTDELCAIVRSLSCWAFALYSGFLSALAFSLVYVIDIKILSLSVSDHPYILSFIIGAIGYTVMTSKFLLSATSDTDTSKAINIIFKKTQTILYHHYAISQNTQLRPTVYQIMSQVNDDNIWEFSRRCIKMAKGINEEKGNQLGESYRELNESSANPSEYKVELGLDLAKIIGIPLLEQIASEIRDLSLSDDIRSLDDTLAQLRQNRPRE